MADAALSKNDMMFVTQEGEGFSGVWAGEFKKYGGKKGEEEYVIKSMICSCFIDFFFKKKLVVTLFYFNQQSTVFKHEIIFFRQEIFFFIDEILRFCFLKFFRGLWPFRCGNDV